MLVEIEILTMMTVDTNGQALDDKLQDKVSNGFRGYMTQEAVAQMIVEMGCTPIECVIQERTREVSKDELEFKEMMEKVMSTLDQAGVLDKMKKMQNKKQQQERLNNQTGQTLSEDDELPPGVIRFPH